jgi:precorrin-6A/cobalt-precorrin-6A reductase
MKILVLGGTSDARRLTTKLIATAVPVDIIYSVAGLVGKAQLDCQVISGGFSKTGGLKHFLERENIKAVLDLTHPYAISISSQAQSACVQLNLAYWQFMRPQWQAQSGDNWHSFSDWPSLLTSIKSYKRALVTTGQLQQSQLDAIASTCDHVCYRTAAPSQAILATNVQWIKAKGPFALDDELAQLKQLQSDVLICKNAGGNATYAKLEAARILGIDVLMLERPASERMIDSAPLQDLDILLAEVVAKVVSYVNERAEINSAKNDNK